LDIEINPPSRRPILSWLIVSQVLAAASLVVWLIVAGLSVMAFDSGVSAEAWTFVIAVCPLGFAIASWIAYARRRDRLAGVFTTFTFLPVLVLILAMLVSNFLFTLGM
jgi:hypothetical protein